MSHPDARQASYREGLAEAKRQVQVSLGKLEILKPRVNKRYERHIQLLRDRGDRDAIGDASEGGQIQLAAVNDPAIAGSARPLAAGENRDFAVRLAQSEFRKRASARVSRSNEAPRDAVPADTNRSKFGMFEGDDEMSARLQDVRSRVIENRDDRKQSIPKDHLTQQETPYKYPSVPRQKDQTYPTVVQSPHSNRAQSSAEISESTIPPTLPAKIPQQPLIPQNVSHPTPPPLIPEKVPPVIELPVDTEVPNNRVSSPASSVDPSTFTFKPSSYLESGTPLRTIFISPNLRKKFLSIAAPNTRQNLETCGILCGSLISNALFISKLVIPEQTSTPDTCEMVNEAAVFDFCESEDLMVFGWIHTHPTQTCFMSSRDLHTQSGYQVMLAESIAIVCAPSHDPDWGVFRLTDPPGLKTVLSCTKPGIFHPHDEPNVYTDALRPGHVFEAKGLEFETVDLRPA